MEAIKSSFSNLLDFRIPKKCLHSLIDILFMSICAVICGADDYVGIRLWALDNEKWLQKHIKLSNGIPSDDTFRRVFQHLDYKLFSECFIHFTQALSKLSNGEVVAIDGKCLRGGKNKSSDKTGIYMVGAWASANQLLLGQEKVEDKSNEITAIPKLLDMLVLKGCTITIDAMGCQKDIAAKIIEKEANYMLAVKGNQGNLEAAIIQSFSLETPIYTHRTCEKDHGRIETRTCEVIQDLKWVEQKDEWCGLKNLVKITSEREIIGEEKKTTFVRYFIGSELLNSEESLAVIRTHWSIENQLHWSLDVTFKEDDNRNRTKNASANFSFLNRIAINLIKKEPSKISIQHKRQKAMRSSSFLEKILQPNIVI